MRIIGNAGTAPRKVQAVASGALATGDTVVVNADGTVSVVAETSASTSFGPLAAASDLNIDNPQITYDSANNKVVAVYSDPDDSNAAYAVVGTVTGANISWGTPVEFAAQGDDPACVYEGTSEKVVVFYRDKANSNRGTARVGTVSGTGISFGGTTVFNSTDTQKIRAAAGNGKILLVYKDVGASNDGKAMACSVSGTTFSFGAENSLNANNVTDDIQVTYASGYEDPSGDSNVFGVFYRDTGNSSKGTARVCYFAANGTNNVTVGSETIFNNASSTPQGKTSFDTVNNKFVIVYTDGGNSSYQAAIVGTIVYSGIDPTMTFGTEVIVNAAESYNGGSAYHPISGTHVVVYQGGSSFNGFFKLGTVSGTGISFSSAVEFLSQVGGQYDVVYNSGSENVVSILRSSTGTGRKPTGVTLQPAYTSTNLTAENYIGIASNGYATGQAATINVKGFVDDNQSSLTAGQSYYVQTNGDLGLTADDPSVFAGTAISATKLLVKT